VGRHDGAHGPAFCGNDIIYSSEQRLAGRGDQHLRWAFARPTQYLVRDRKRSARAQEPSLGLTRDHEPSLGLAHQRELDATHRNQWRHERDAQPDAARLP
jgi:hypothetical protein